MKALKNLEPVIAALQRGDFVAVADDDNREHEADLIIAAELLTPEKMAFLIRYTSGIIAVPMKKERLDAIGLEKLETNNPANFDTPFTISVDLKSKTRGGVSAQERVHTIQALIDPNTDPSDLGRPGHVFPLQAHEGGIEARNGHTEASIALLELAEMYPAAAIGELMNDNGEMMRGAELQAFLQKHAIPFCTVDDILDLVRHSTS